MEDEKSRIKMENGRRRMEDGGWRIRIRIGIRIGIRMEDGG